jgi:hypothetical protein
MLIQDHTVTTRVADNDKNKRKFESKTSLTALCTGWQLPPTKNFPFHDALDYNPKTDIFIGFFTIT